MIIQNIKIEELTGYQVDEDNILIGAPCCCYGDTHNGHPYCQDTTSTLLQAEREGLIVRIFDGGWRWVVST